MIHKCMHVYARSGGMDFDYDSSKSCGSSEQYWWAVQAEAWAQREGFAAQYNFSTTRNRRIILILPGGVSSLPS